jgi:membrane protein implicated in regulation of membrane protease activity
MKNFLLAFKKYSLGYLRSIAPFIPIGIAMGLTGYLAWYSPYQSQQQYIWFAVYSVITASYHRRSNR